MALRTSLVLAAFFLVGSSFVGSSFVGDADAKRVMPPKTKICNKTKHKQYVATTNYAGRGRYRSKGWTYIAAGTCSEFRDASFHFRGTNKKVTGLDTSSTHEACVKNTKVFSLVFGRSKESLATLCAKESGKVVTFYRARRSARTLTIEK